MTDPEGSGSFDVDLDDGPAEEPPVESPIAGAGNSLFTGGVDVTALAAEMIGPAVRKAVGKKVDAVAAEAVTDALTADVLDQLRANADEAAQTIVSGTSPAAEDPAGGAPAAAAAEDTPQLYYGSTDEFVREYLRHVYKRKIDGQHAFWSPQWWKFAEAIARLEALWRAWEHLRLDPSTGPSVWWRDHADPHMRMLMSSIGPFGKEIDTRSTVLEPLPYQPPPEGLFPDVRETTLG